MTCAVAPFSISQEISITTPHVSHKRGCERGGRDHLRWQQSGKAPLENQCVELIWKEGWEFSRKKQMGRVMGPKSKPRIEADDSFYTGLRGNEKNKGKLLRFSES